jgi:hypothetical protein
VSDDWSARIDGNTKRRGFSLDAKGFFNEIVFMIPE